MSKFNLFQIYYDEATKALLDPDFTPLDNSNSLNASWYEFWPIREYLKSEQLDPCSYYGFFSPKFNFKTGLKGRQVLEVLNQHEDADVVLFSPFFENTAYYLNVFEQASQHHGDFDAISKKSAHHLNLEINPMNMVMHSLNTVFCNFFVAKPHFWLEWLSFCEKIYEEAEANTTDLGQLLNTQVRHDGRPVQNKIFIIERIASLLMGAYPNKWIVRSIDPTMSSFGDSVLANHKETLLQLDALKMAGATRQSPIYTQFFFKLRDDLNEKLRLIT